MNPLSRIRDLYAAAGKQMDAVRQKKYTKLEQKADSVKDALNPEKLYDGAKAAHTLINKQVKDIGKMEKQLQSTKLTSAERTKMRKELADIKVKLSVNLKRLNEAASRARRGLENRTIISDNAFNKEIDRLDRDAEKKVGKRIGIEGELNKANIAELENKARIVVKNRKLDYESFEKAALKVGKDLLNAKGYELPADKKRYLDDLESRLKQTNLNIPKEVFLCEIKYFLSSFPGMQFPFEKYPRIQEFLKGV